MEQHCESLEAQAQEMKPTGPDRRRREGTAIVWFVWPGQAGKIFGANHYFY